MSLMYILDDEGNPIPESDSVKWAAWIEQSPQRRVGRDIVAGQLVSTVFLGIDHRFGSIGPPILWETMIFPQDDGSSEEYSGFQRRYTSLEEAKKGHWDAVFMVSNDHGEVLDGEALDELEI